MKLTAQPVTGTAFTDHRPELKNGRPQTYGVAAVYEEVVRSRLGVARRRVDGPMVMRAATPVAAPPGFLGTSTNEGPLPGSVEFDRDRGEIILRGSGPDIWGWADGFYFLNRPESGDFQVTVTLQAGPSASNDWAKAGIMIRESLDARARYAYLLASPEHGLGFQWRANRSGYSDAIPVLPKEMLKRPHPEGTRLRLTRRGDEVVPEYSWDGGRSFQPAGSPYRFEAALPGTVYVGLAITAHNSAGTAEAKFSGLEIRKR